MVFKASASIAKNHSRKFSELFSAWRSSISSDGPVYKIDDSAEDVATILECIFRMNKCVRYTFIPLCC
jgi:hypothetical protein